MVKNPPANAGDIKRHGFDPLVGESPWKREWEPTPVLLPAEPYGQRSLVGYGPWVSELDMTEGLSTYRDEGLAQSSVVTSVR